MHGGMHGGMHGMAMRGGGHFRSGGYVGRGFSGTSFGHRQVAFRTNRHFGRFYGGGWRYRERVALRFGYPRRFHRARFYAAGVPYYPYYYRTAYYRTASDSCFRFRHVLRPVGWRWRQVWLCDGYVRHRPE